MLDRNHFVVASFSVWVYSIFLKNFYFFIFGCAGSSLLLAGVLAVEPGDCAPLWCAGVSLQ